MVLNFTKFLKYFNNTTDEYINNQKLKDLIYDSTIPLNQLYDFNVSDLYQVDYSRHDLKNYTESLKKYSFMYYISDIYSDNISIPVENLDITKIKLYQMSFNAYKQELLYDFNLNENLSNKFELNSKFIIDNSLKFNLSVDILGATDQFDYDKEGGITINGIHYDVFPIFYKFLSAEYYNLLENYSMLYEQKNLPAYKSIMYQYIYGIKQNQMSRVINNSGVFESLNNIENTLKLKDIGLQYCPCDVSWDILGIDWFNTTIIFDGSFNNFQPTCLNYFNTNIQVNITHEDIPVINKLWCSKKNEYTYQLADFDTHSNILRYYYDSQNYYTLNISIYNSVYGRFLTGVNLFNDCDIISAPDSQQIENKDTLFKNGTIIQFSDFFEQTSYLQQIENSDNGQEKIPDFIKDSYYNFDKSNNILTIEETPIIHNFDSNKIIEFINPIEFILTKNNIVSIAQDSLNIYSDDDGEIYYFGSYEEDFKVTITTTGVKTAAKIWYIYTAPIQNNEIGIWQTNYGATGQIDVNHDIAELITNYNNSLLEEQWDYNVHIYINFYAIEHTIEELIRNDEIEKLATARFTYYD